MLVENEKLEGKVASCYLMLVKKYKFLKVSVIFMLSYAGQVSYSSYQDFFFLTNVNRF